MTAAQSVPLAPEPAHAVTAVASPAGVVALAPGAAPTPTPEATAWLASLARVAAVASVGNTPLLRLHNLATQAGLPESIEIWLKAEWTNPGGSIKDRPALSIIRAAIADGRLRPGMTLLDSTSGNTGIAYALLGAALEIPVELIVPGSASRERQQILRAYGATVTISDPYDGSNGAIREARERASTAGDRYFFADQYRNPANPAAHFTGTGPEIWNQTGGQVTHLVAGLGTTGTLMGIGRYLKARKPSVQLAAVQPAEEFHGIEGLKHLPTAIVPDIYDETVPDRQIGIDTDDAYDLTRALTRSEGLFAGASTGAALAGAIALGRELAERGEPATIVAVAPDGGGRYLSTGLWV